MTLQNTLGMSHGFPSRAPVARPPRFGFIAGWRAFRTHAALAALSDGELARRGLTRADLPRLAARRAGLIRD